MRRKELFALSFVVVPGCVRVIDNEGSWYGTVLRDCVVLGPEGRALGAPVSLEYPRASLWIWRDGAGVPNAGARVESFEAACSGAFGWLGESDDVPDSLLRLTIDEEAENASRHDGRRVALEPSGGFTHDDVGYLYFEKVLLGPDFFDRERLGTGLCVFDEPDAPCRRLEPAVRAEDPTLLWGPSDRAWNQGGFVDADGWAYLVGCLHAAAFEDLCTLARVQPTEVADPDAYEYYNAFSGWIEDSWNASVVLEAPAAVTIDSGADGRYRAVVSDIWSSSIQLLLAEHPWGEWERGVTLFDAVPTEIWLIEGGREHAALANGDALAISYATNPTGEATELHLVLARPE